MLNPPLQNLTDFPITYLEGFRHDTEMTERPADKTNFIIFDTPGIPNSFMYNDAILTRYMCKLKYEFERSHVYENKNPNSHNNGRGDQ